MKGQIEVYKDKDYAACPICGNAGKHREDCYVSLSLKAQTSGGYAQLADVRKQAGIVRQRLEYHFRLNNNKGYMIPESMPFMKEFFGEIDTLLRSVEHFS